MGETSVEEQTRGGTPSEESTRGGAPSKEYFIDKLAIRDPGRNILTAGREQGTSSEEPRRSVLTEETFLLGETEKDGSEGPEKGLSGS